MKDVMKIYNDASAESFSKFYGYNPTTDEQKHVVEIGSSIMMYRDGILNGGGFVTAFVNNDLIDAINRADKTVINHFPFLANIKQYGHIND